MSHIPLKSRPWMLKIELNVLAQVGEQNKINGVGTHTHKFK